MTIVSETERDRTQPYATMECSADIKECWSQVQVYFKCTKRGGISFLLASVASFACVYLYNPGCHFVVFKHTNQVSWPWVRHLPLVYLRGHCVHFAEPHTQGDHHAAWSNALLRFEQPSRNSLFASNIAPWRNRNDWTIWSLPGWLAPPLTPHSYCWLALQFSKHYEVLRLPGLCAREPEVSKVAAAKATLERCGLLVLGCCLADGTKVI